MYILLVEDSNMGARISIRCTTCLHVNELVANAILHSSKYYVLSFVYAI